MEKKKFNFKKDYYEIFKELTDKQAGELIKGLCAYAYERKPFITKDTYLKGAFLYVKRELDVSEQNRINGKKGAEVLAEKRRRSAVGGIGLVLGSIMAARCGEKNDEKKA